MVAWAGYELYSSGKGTVLIDREDIELVDAIARWPLGRNEEDTIFGTKYPDVVKMRRRGAPIVIKNNNNNNNNNTSDTEAIANSTTSTQTGNNSSMSNRILS